MSSTDENSTSTTGVSNQTSTNVLSPDNGRKISSGRSSSFDCGSLSRIPKTTVGHLVNSRLNSLQHAFNILKHTSSHGSQESKKSYGSR